MYLKGFFFSENLNRKDDLEQLSVHWAVYFYALETLAFRR